MLFIVIWRKTKVVLVKVDDLSFSWMLDYLYEHDARSFSWMLDYFHGCSIICMLTMFMYIYIYI